LSLTAQEFMLQGNIKSSMGEPLVGVSVVPKEGGTPVISDLDGNFWVSAKIGDVLQFSYVGFATKEVRVRNSAILWVIMEDEDSLDTNVYAVGYSNRRKSDVASPIVGITPDGINQGWNTTVQEMLMGRIAGLNVTTDGGAPGTGAVMRIRQGASLSANSEPLIVIDGFPIDHSGITGLANPLSIINPNDVKSFTILKDVTASAIYGQRGANGVIQITTKKGKVGE
ncbi:MAG: TonB-dependent receptor plug domain-containing protein, partial [Tannerellaceae bacterium]|nr:TonB-dependent receptor plug domain-containing protein [Tannerellaceae bacterium]